MARSQGAKHRARRQKVGGVTKIAAFLAMATTVASAGIQPAQQPQLQASRTVQTDYNLLGLVGYQANGTGSTVPNPPPGTPDVSWIDSGIWTQISDIRTLTDSEDYPATLESSGPKSGTNSVNRGATTLVSWILQNDPNTTVSAGAGGSQGALVWYEVLRRLAAMGYPMENVFVVLYSDPGMPGTGILSRFGPNQMVLTTGLMGGAPTLPSTGTYVRVVNDGDPMAFFPKDPFNALALANAVAGFVFEHGKLGYIDYSKATITTQGNVTTVVAHPYGDIVPLLVPLKLLNVPDQLVEFVNKLIRPIILAGGMYEQGRMQTAPSLENIVRQIRATFEGIGDATQYALKLVLHQPTSTSGNPTPVSSPTDGLIHQAEDRDNVLNGTTSSSESSFGARAVTINSSVATAQPQVQSEQSDAPDEATQPLVQQQAPVRDAQEETPKQPDPKPSDPSDNAKSDVPKVDASSSVHVTEQNDQQDQDASDKKPDEPKKKRPVSHRDDSDAATSSQHQSTTTVHHQSEDTDDSSSQSSPKPKVHMPTGKHDSEQGASASGSGHSTSSDTSGGNES